MKTTVKILGGGYSYTRDGRPAVAYHGELVSVDEAEAVRLSNLRMAAIIDGKSAPSASSHLAGAQSASVGGLSPDPTSTTKSNSDATDAGDGVQGEPDQSVSEGIALRDSLGIVDGHFVRDDLMSMERKEMEALASDLGIDVGKCRNKGEIADILSAVEIDIAETDGDDGEEPPNLGAEGPVV